MFKKMLIVVALLGVCVSVFGDDSYRKLYADEYGVEDTLDVTFKQRCEMATAVKIARYLNGVTGATSGDRDYDSTYAVSGISFTTENMTNWCLRGNLNINSVYKRLAIFFRTAAAVETSGEDAVTDVQLNAIIHRVMPIFASLIGTGSL